MQKIDFINGQQPAINDDNLNLMQTYIETAINAQVSGDTLPIGSIMPYGSDIIPENWLLCDGSAVSRTDYAILFSVIGTTYGVGDGSTTFNLPNLKGKVAVGKDTTQTEFDMLGETGGEKKHTLTIDEMPSHNHGWKWSTHATQGTGEWSSDGSGSVADDVIANTGGGQPHNILQPYITLNYVIKASQNAGLVATVVDNLNSTSTTDGLSANQGKVLKEKFIPQYMTATVSTNYSISAGTTAVLFDTVANSNGNKLTLNNNKIVIGTGVSYIRVNGAIFVESPSNGYLWSILMKNDSIRIASVLTPVQNDSYVSSAIPSIVIPVSEGDTISLYRDCGGNAVRGGRDNTWLQVEVLY